MRLLDKTSPNKNKRNTEHLICRQQRAEGKKDTILPSSDAMLQVKQSKSEICAVVPRAPRDVNQNTWMQQFYPRGCMTGNVVFTSNDTPTLT